MLVAGAILVSASCSSSFAQTISAEPEPYMRCGYWTPVAADPRNTVRFVIPASLSEPGEAVSASGQFAGRPGIFVIPKGVLLGFLSTPNGNEITGQFTVASGSSILFKPDPPRRITPFGAPATVPSTSVRGGVISMPLDSIVGYPWRQIQHRGYFLGGQSARDIQADRFGGCARHRRSAQESGKRLRRHT